MDGKVTIESGEYKTIVSIKQDENGEQKVYINFEPKLDLKINSPEINFVANFTNIIIEILKG